MSFKNNRSEFYDIKSLQAEVLRLERENFQHVQSFKQLQMEANKAVRQMSEQGQQVDAMRMTSVVQMVGLLLEHHEGEVTVSIPLLDEVAKAEYQVEGVVQPGGILKLTVKDGKGQMVTAGKITEDAANTIQKKAVEAAAEVPVEFCSEPDCGLAAPLHARECRNHPLNTVIA